jgi:hypothetical protein
MMRARLKTTIIALALACTALMAGAATPANAAGRSATIRTATAVPHSYPCGHGMVARCAKVDVWVGCNNLINVTEFKGVVYWQSMPLNNGLGIASGQLVDSCPGATTGYLHLVWDSPFGHDVTVAAAHPGHPWSPHGSWYGTHYPPGHIGVYVCQRTSGHTTCGSTQHV